MGLQVCLCVSLFHSFIFICSIKNYFNKISEDYLLYETYHVFRNKLRNRVNKKCIS